MCEILNRAGYRTIDAADGTVALGLARRNAGKVALAIVDITMPGMNGREVREALLAEDSSMDVLHVSGGVLDEDLAAWLRREQPRLLDKPFEPAALVHSVRAILQGRLERQRRLHLAAT